MKEKPISLVCGIKEESSSQDLLLLELLERLSKIELRRKRLSNRSTSDEFTWRMKPVHLELQHSLPQSSRVPERTFNEFLGPWSIRPKLEDPWILHQSMTWNT